MRTLRLRSLLAAIAVFTLVAAACGDEPTTDPVDTGTESPSPSEEPDLLARIQEDGMIRVSTDPKYKPQSFLNTKTGEWEGFDIDVAQEIANRLGVEVQYETPAWELIIAGAWNDRWDMSVGSMTPTEERAEVLHFASPGYYGTPASVAVHADNTSVADLESDLDGKKIGVCGGCTYDLFLQGSLNIPGYDYVSPIDDPEIVTYDTDRTAIENLALGDGSRLDAAISALPTIQDAIDEGTPIKVVGDPVFSEPLAVAFDKSAPLDPTSLLEEVSRIIQEMHDDGTLTSLSMKWFDEDLTQGL